VGRLWDISGVAWIGTWRRFAGSALGLALWIAHPQIASRDFRVRSSVSRVIPISPAPTMITVFFKLISIKNLEYRVTSGEPDPKPEPNGKRDTSGLLDSLAMISSLPGLLRAG